eukprot:Sspe_Gene.59211::Locus_32517_Transcript_1_1_Confidence_1.000_Length_2494::g.59211::m.59211
MDNHDDDANESCMVCLEDFGNDRVPMTVCPLGHILCHICTEDYKGNDKCPACRTKKLRNPIRNHVALGLIEATQHRNRKRQPLAIPWGTLGLASSSAGRFADVHRGEWEGAPVVVKVVHNGLLSGERADLLHRLSHPNMVRIYGITEDPSGKPGYVMEHLPSSLASAIPTLSPVERIRVARGVVSVLRFLHSKNIAHLGVKPTNVLLDASKMPKLADFGLSDKSAKYAAPEFIDSNVQGTAGDMYSLGILLWEVFSSSHYLDGMNDAQVRQVREARRTPDVARGAFPGSVGPLVQRMWSEAPGDRPPIEEVASALAEAAKNPGERLAAGSSILIPECHERLHRLGYPDAVLPYCGQKGEVKDLRRHGVVVQLADSIRFTFSYSAFPADVTRLCYRGCDLGSGKSDGSAVCSACSTLLPRGAPLWGCREHSYNMCSYCSGNATEITQGMTVVRGPTWKWQGQDGQPYDTGVVNAIRDDGWVSVTWDSGHQNVYRLDPLQDVVPCYEGVASHAKRAVRREGCHEFARDSSLSITSDGKEARSYPEVGTVLTSEMLRVDHRTTHSITFELAAKPGAAVVGIVGANLLDYTSSPLGSFSGSWGLVPTDNGVCLKASDMESATVSGVMKPGSKVVVEVSPAGKVAFVVDGKVLRSQHEVSGWFHFGVSLRETGGAVLIAPSTTLSIGELVTVPENERSTNKKHPTEWCGKVAKVVDLGLNNVTLQVGGCRFVVPYCAFPADVVRTCPKQCNLMACKTKGDTCICDSCTVRLPSGTPVQRCHEHDFDLCSFCQGKTEVVSPGMRVVRGPTWKWGDQDGGSG